MLKRLLLRVSLLYSTLLIHCVYYNPDAPPGPQFLCAQALLHYQVGRLLVLDITRISAIQQNLIIGLTVDIPVI